VIVDLIFSHLGDIASLVLPARAAGALPLRALPAFPAPGGPVPIVSGLDWISRLAALSSQDTVAGLLWLAMHSPTVCDAMLDKTEFDAIDDEEDYPRGEPEPYCTSCGADAGIFTAHAGGMTPASSRCFPTMATERARAAVVPPTCAT
jgi:hypothetical protein